MYLLLPSEKPKTAVKENDSKATENDNKDANETLNN